MRVALTGGIGAGKSAVATLLRERGALVIDADALARQVVEPGSAALQEIVESFGSDVLDGSGALDRARLAALVFADPSALERLNAITHPRVAALREEQLARCPGDSVVVEDIPLLVESGFVRGAGPWDVVVVVDAPDDVRLERLLGRGMSREDALARMARQADRQVRLAAADVVIDNSGERHALARQVDALWQRLVSDAPERA